MKNVVFLLIFVLSFSFVKAQNDKFTQAMVLTLEKMKTAQTSAAYQETANTFERIAASEKTQWTAWYYAAWSNLMINFRETDRATKQKYIDHAIQLIDEGLKVKPEESELLVIKVMALYGEMAIDPAIAIDLYPKTVELLEKAKSSNPDNPRIYLTQAEAVYNMPEAYGGGKDKAGLILQEAKKKFDKFIRSDSISPDWGKDRCEMLLTSCQKIK